MNLVGKTVKMFGLDPIVDTYKEGKRASARYAEMEATIQAQVGQISQMEKELDDLRTQLTPSYPYLSKPHQYPGIIFNTLPKSGSVYIGKTLAQSLDIEYLEYAITHGFFPNYYVIEHAAARLPLGNVLRQEHFNPDPINLNVLAHHTDRLVVHVRDPRQATLSWYHHFDRLRREHSDGVNYTIHQAPDGYDDWAFEKKIDWHIETHLVSCVQWISDWMDAEENGWSGQLLFTRYEDFIADQDAFFRRILDFYDIPQEAFDLKAASLTLENNYRKGKSDEWVGVFTDAQASRAKEIIGPKIFSRFNWDSA